MSFLRTTFAGLVLFAAAGFSVQAAEESPDFLHEELRAAHLVPSLYDHVFRIPVMNARSGDIRYMTAFREISRDGLDDLLSRSRQQGEGELFPDAPLVRTLADGSLDCDCTAALRADEFIISESDVFDHSAGRYVSLNDESYKAILELRDYPLTDDRSVAVAFSELVYVYNERAIRSFLEARGYDLVLSYGFMDSETYPGVDDTQFILVREKGNGRYIVAIRGTSGVADLKTNINAAMEAWIGAGRVHNGFARTMDVIAGELEVHDGDIRASGHPVLVLGHSLGGAASILLTIALNERGIDAHAINVAPPPVGDRGFEEHYKEIGERLINLFLPGEELDTADKPQQFQWMRLVGGKHYLDDVGKTAGAVHFVINYLKSVLKSHGGDVLAYSNSLPVCVFEKSACFLDDVIQFAPLCLFEDWSCFERHAGKLIRLEPYEVEGTAVRYLDRLIAARLGGQMASLEGLDRKLVSEAYVDAKTRLLNGAGSEHRRDLVLFRLGLMAILLEEYNEAVRFLDVLRQGDSPEPISGYYRIVAMLLSGAEEGAVEAAVNLFNQSPPKEIAARTRELLFGGKQPQ